MRLAITVCCLGLASAACTASILGDKDPHATPGMPLSGAATPGTGETATNPDVAWPVALTGHASGLRRLSRDELITSLRMLTGQAPLRADLPEEQRSGHELLRTTGTAFISSEVSKLQPVIEDFAAQVAPGILAQTGCVAHEQAQRDCLLGWTRTFAQRALRRAPRSDDADSYRAVLASADGSSGADVAAMTGILTAVFFAPSFLYRTEMGAASSTTPGARELQGIELASKLSFLATLGPPDAELLTAASAGRLSDGAERLQQLQRLSATADGKRARSVFVLEWLGANESKVDQKSPSYLEGLDADYASQARASAEAFIEGVLAGPDPSVTQLLTGTGYATDPAVQAITGAATIAGVATGDDAGAVRLGLLMHPQVISSHSKENGASPFQLGLFLKEVLLCEAVGAPPPGATDMTKEDVPDGLSLRESLSYRTSASPVCSACHSQFAPLGYSFIAFDPLGRWVHQDPSGKPWDLSGSVATARGEPLVFATPAELIRTIAARPQAQGCFAQKALEWSLGRGLVAEDLPSIVALDQRVRTSGGNVPAILQAIVGSPEFTTARALH